MENGKCINTHGLITGQFEIKDQKAVASYKFGHSDWFINKTLPLSLIGGPYCDFLQNKFQNDPILASVENRIDERLAIQGEVLLEPHSKSYWHPQDMGKQCVAVFHDTVLETIDILRFKVTDGVKVCGNEGLWIEVLSMSNLDLLTPDEPITHQFVATKYPLIGMLSDSPEVMFVDIDTLLDDVDGDIEINASNLRSLGAIMCNPNTFRDPFVNE